jgi:hypothetical protein
VIYQNFIAAYMSKKAADAELFYLMDFSQDKSIDCQFIFSRDVRQVRLKLE